MSQMQQLMDGFEARLKAVEGSLGIAPGGGVAMAGGGSASPAASVAPFVQTFDDHVSMQLEPFTEAAGRLGGKAQELSAIVSKAWQAQRDFLVMASECKKPSQEVMMGKIGPLKECMGEASNAKSRDDWALHANMVSEGLSCLSWVLMSPPTLPADIVDSAIGGSDYHSNKLRVQYKQTSPEQVSFVDAFKGLLKGLKEYVETQHKTGITWNPRGGDVASYSAGGGGGAAAPAGASDAAPPAPPTPAAAAPVKAAAGGGGGGLANVFGELSKGLQVTSGLKKVTKEQQTWRKEYAGGDEAAAPVAPAPPTAPKVNSRDQVKGPPKCEFKRAGNKWEVENQSSAITVDVTDIKHQVYIYGCINATITITGKCKGVVVDNCKKTKVILDDALSSVETVNCQRIKIEITGSVPSVAIDKSDGVLITVSEKGMDVTFTTSKSSEMNINFPAKDEDGEPTIKELPIPEQFVHTLKQAEGGGEGEMHITSDVSDLYTH